MRALSFSVTDNRTAFGLYPDLPWTWMTLNLDDLFSSAIWFVIMTVFAIA